jgi:4a-hydroxytetrahydrobiopterin dehydratase
MTCTAAAPRMSEEEISERLSLLDGWSKAEVWIEKRFRFKNFLRAMLFVNAVAHLAETVNQY